jgi:hypothetical protein
MIEDLKSVVREEMIGREDEVRNVGCECDNVSSGCETRWES